MSDTPNKPDSSEIEPAADRSHAPVRRASRSLPPPRPAPVVREEPPEKRRDFFSDATREMLAPFAGLLERKIQPLLAALEALPTEAERFAKTPIGQGTGLGRLLDQPLDQQNTLLPPGAAEAEPERFLHPPGAVQPNADHTGGFENLCTRCGDCVRACPANAILMHDAGYIASGLPYIIPREQPCVVCTSLACMPACPTGALKLVDRLQLNMGTAKVDHHQCLRSNGEDCRLCIEACPITGENGAPIPPTDAADGAVPAGDVPRHLDAIFIHAQTGRIRVRKNVCVGCGLCENRCPTEPAAIEVIPRKVRKDPIIA